MSEQGRGVPVINMTNFFNRELFMHSLGDIKFKKPVSMKKVGYTTAFLVIWCVPILLIFGLQINLLYIAILLVPPVVLGHWAAKPVWMGRGLLDFVKVTFAYIGEPKAWTDLNPAPKEEKDIYHIENRTWVSRRREIRYLAAIDQNKEK